VEEAGLVEFQYRLNGLMTVASWPEAIRRVMKRRFEDRLEKSTQDFLTHPIANGWDTPRQLHSTPRGIWDGRPSLIRFTLYRESGF